MLGSPPCAICTLAPWEVRQLVLHYTLIGRDFEEVMRSRNDTTDIYPALRLSAA